MESKKTAKPVTKVATRPKFKQIKDANRIRIHLMESGNLEGVLIEGDTIEGFNFRARPLRGVFFKDAIFKGCNFTGSNWTGAQVKGCTFIDCKMPFGANLDSIKSENEFVNCRLS